ncbi:G-protein coupled receptor [Branchiostoma belcheri]|nr:G-protein coupled receptor [Branchiostoma belcheri]
MDMIDIPFEELVELLANISKTEEGREVMKSITMDRYRLSRPVIGLSVLAYSLVFVLCLIAVPRVESLSPAVRRSDPRPGSRTSGNILVLIVVIRTPRTRTITNYFILNLTISDLLVASSACRSRNELWCAVFRDWGGFSSGLQKQQRGSCSLPRSTQLGSPVGVPRREFN